MQIKQKKMLCYFCYLFCGNTSNNVIPHNMHPNVQPKKVEVSKPSLTVKIMKCDLSFNF